MPNWPELRHEVIIDIVKDDAEVGMYLKDKYWENKKAHSKPFFLTIVNNVYPGLI